MKPYLNLKQDILVPNIKYHLSKNINYLYISESLI